MKEYGIAMDDSPSTLHRGPLSQEEAEVWMDSLPEKLRGMFVIVSREVSPWTPDGV